MPSSSRFRVQELALSRAGGVALILGGLAVAAYGMPSGTGSNAPQSAAQADVGNSARVDQPPSQDVSVLGRLAALRPIAFAPVSAPVVVTIPQRASEASVVPSLAAAIPRDRGALARELQKELRRVGCYDGELNGAWTPSTRRAMKAFTDRVNATLPVEEPDGVLFAMVQGQQDRVCGKPCPVGQGISEDGRCLPNAILAKATKKAAPPAAMAQLPKAYPQPAERSTPAVTGWSTTITAVAPTPPPSVIAAAPAVASPPTEGRMALAGPATEPTPPGAGLPYNAPPPALRPPAPPNRVVQRTEAGWARTMHTRLFQRPNN